MSQKKTIFIGFPGVGKTTYAMNHVGFIDLDFGTYRASLGVMPEKNSFLFPQFSRLVKMYVNDGWNVLTNEPGLIPVFKQMEMRTVMVLPSDKADMGKRILEREKQHPVSKAFAQSYNDNWKKWVSDWENTAKKYAIPIIKVNYMEEIDYANKEN